MHNQFFRDEYWLILLIGINQTKRYRNLTSSISNCRINCNDWTSGWEFPNIENRQATQQSSLAGIRIMPNAFANYHRKGIRSLIAHWLRRVIWHDTSRKLPPQAVKQKTKALDSRREANYFHHSLFKIHCQEPRKTLWCIVRHVKGGLGARIE